MRYLYGIKKTPSFCAECGEQHTPHPTNGMQIDKWLKLLHKKYIAAANFIFKKKEYKTEYLNVGAVKQLREELVGYFTEAVQTGLEHTDNHIPDAMRKKMDEDLFIFSACKTESELREVGALLRNADGTLKSRAAFISEVQSLYKGHIGAYLQAEHSFATASSQMAAKWHNYAADGDAFHLQYRTAQDDRVRDSHAKLANVTLPITDPFWDKYFPPNGWRCRCTVVQVKKGKYPLSDSAKAMADGNSATPTEKLHIFRFNPGKQGTVFPPHHPYMQEKTKIEAVLAKQKPTEERKIAQRELRDSILGMDRDMQFETQKEYDNGGKVLEHLLVNPEGIDYGEVNNVADYFAKNGQKAEVLPIVNAKSIEGRKKIYPDAKENKCADLRIDGVLWEVESTEKFENVSKRISGGAKQADNVVLILKYEQKDSLEGVSNVMFNAHKDLKEIIIMHPNKAAERYTRKT